MAPLIDHWAIPTFGAGKAAARHSHGALRGQSNQATVLRAPMVGPAASSKSPANTPVCAIPITTGPRAGKAGRAGKAASEPEQLAHAEEIARMARLSLFNSPFLLGFDEFEQTIDRIAKASNDGYPPYNIEQTGPNTLRITLAVAGFTMDDLVVTVEGRQLIVKGRQTDDDNRVYLHRGIAARQFQRTFMLAEGIDVDGASLDNGLLNIDLERPAVEEPVRTVKIKPGAEKVSAKVAGSKATSMKSAPSHRGETIDVKPEKTR